MADSGTESAGGSANHGHVPVLLDRCGTSRPALTRTAPDGSGAVLVDATLGAGGHAERFLERFSGLRLIGLDRDPDALSIAGVGWPASVTGSISSAPAMTGSPTRCASADCRDGLGGWSLVRPRCLLDATGSPGAGFLHAHDAPLDMRMDRRPS